ARDAALSSSRATARTCPSLTATPGAARAATTSCGRACMPSGPGAFRIAGLHAVVVGRERCLRGFAAGAGDRMRLGAAAGLTRLPVRIFIRPRHLREIYSDDGPLVRAGRLVP